MKSDKHRSDASDCLEVALAVYKDACALCPAKVSDLRDIDTMISRTKEEGLSFLTISLPNFCRDLEKALQRGYVDSTDFHGFEKIGTRRKPGPIPAFLQGMVSRIFCRETGRIYDEVNTPTFVSAVRQICLLFKKVEVPCSPERTFKALNNFAKVEQDFRDFSIPFEDLRQFGLVSDVLWGNMLGNILPDMLLPRHGPGATAERISGNSKYVWDRWHERLESFFPHLSFAYNLLAADDEAFEKVTFVKEHDEQPVRVVTVPKTLKSPRVIAIEPVCNMYTQQAVKEALYESIETYWLSRGQVNFTDQSVNQWLALASSHDGQFVTIDLSDASDRVPLSLALRMFGSNPELRDAIYACRSKYAELPDGQVIGPLRKFASMGSALCFPVEAMYFYTICVMALLDAYNLPVSPANLYKVSRDVFVYGDDIIVPRHAAVSVLDHLHKYHCKVNNSKTFLTGKFRESCGVDAYDGYEVTPTYLRSLRPKNRRQAPELISWIQTGNQFYLKGYWHTATLMFAHVGRILGSLPYVSPRSQGLGRISYLGYRSATRWNDSLHRFEVKAWVPSPVYRSDRIDGYPALSKCLLNLERRPDNPDDSTVEKDHLDRIALHGEVTLKLRWVPAT